MPTYIVDDQSDSPALVYTGGWGPLGGTCSGCTIGTNSIPINPAMAEGNSWHDVTVAPGGAEAAVSVTFTGTRINAYCILPPNQGPPFIATTFLSFALDGEPIGSGFKWTGTTGIWTYNHSVFSSNTLTNGQHTFTLSASSNGTQSSYLVFDYFAYDFEDNVIPSTVSSSSSSRGSSSSSGSSVRSTSVTSTSPTATTSSTSIASTFSSFSSNKMAMSSSSTATSSVSTAHKVSTPTSSTSPAATDSAPSTFPSPSSVISVNTSTLPSAVGNTTRTGTPKPTIAGAAVGSLLVVWLLVLLVLWLVRRRKAKLSRAPLPFDLYLPQQILEHAVHDARPESTTTSSSDDTSVMESTRNLPTDTRPGSESIPNRLITITEYLARWRVNAERKRGLPEEGGSADGQRLKRDTELLTAARDELNSVLQQKAQAGAEGSGAAVTT